MQPIPQQPQQPASATRPPQKTSGLALTAFILSLIIFVPLLPLIGAILGIVSLATFRSDRRGRGLAIAAIPVGLVVFFFIQAMMAAIAIPAFIKYIRKSKTVEATESLDKLVLGTRSYFQADRYDANGHLLPKGFPVAKTDWTPRTPCCEQPDHKCPPLPAEWQGEPWRSLQFQLADAHYFQYRYESDGHSASIEAQADLDCDGRFSNYRMLLFAAGSEVTRRGPIITDEIE